MAMKWMTILLLVLGGARLAHAQLAERSFRYDLALDIDTQGHVAHVTLPDGVPAPFVAPLEKAASGWVFKAPVRNGVPVTARTYARVRLVLVPQDKEHYGLRIDVLSNGPSLAFTRNPTYPPEAIRNRAEGIVYMSALVQPDGHLTRIVPTRAELSHYGALSTQRASGLFSKAAEEAMQTMQAKPEWVDGKPVATPIVLPVTFGLSRVISIDADATGSAVGR
jgi:hypothetical protein